VAQNFYQIEGLHQQSNLLVLLAVMGGLSLDKDRVRQIFRRELMKESAIYQQWRQENLAEGQDTERRSIALKMLAEGMSLEVIAKITGYSVKQLQSLQS
jgi:predicted transposase/invertase (TIGR01784 family)